MSIIYGKIGKILRLPPVDLLRKSMRRGHGGCMKNSAPVAQLDRASAYGAGCCWFDPSQAHLNFLFLVFRKIHPAEYAKIFKENFGSVYEAGYPCMNKIDEIYMSEALKEAREAFGEDEVPVGAVIIYKGKIIARGHNQVERLKDPTAHAEMLALTSATNYLSSKWLNGVSIYVTIEPCSMCAGALVLSRIKNLYFGA